LLPTFNLNNLALTRLIAGGNPFDGRSAFNEERAAEMRRFYTDDEVMKTFARCEECGINTMMLRADAHAVTLLDEYNRRGGAMQWIALLDAHTMEVSAQCPPAAVCIDSTTVDSLFLNGEYDTLKAMLAQIRAKGFCTGLATCLPEVLEYADKQAWEPDFYVCSIYTFGRDAHRQTGFVNGDELDIYPMYSAIRQTARPCIAAKILTSERRRCRVDYVEAAYNEAYQNIKLNDAVVVGFNRMETDQIAAGVQYAQEAIKGVDTLPYRGQYDGIGTWTEHAADGIPAYWEDAVETAVQKVNRHTAEGEHVSSMIFFADSHWEQNNGNIVPLIKAMKEKTGVRRVVFGGDFLQGQPLLADAARAAADWVRQMNTLGEDGWYTVRGNHDNNACWGAFSAKEVWSDDDFYDNVMRYAKNARADGSRELYNYADDVENKIRYYFLDTHSSGAMPPDPESINKVPFETQMAWLRQTASELTPDWGIVVIQHCGFTEYRAKEEICYTEEERKWFPTLDGLGSPVYDADGRYLGPYMGNVGFNQHGIAQTYGRAVVPPLNEIALDPGFPEVIAVITGHTHWDASLRTDGGYYLIATTCDAGSTSSQCFDTLCPARTPGTDREQLLDVVQIDREKRRVFFTRLGAGIDREFTY